MAFNGSKYDGRRDRMKVMLVGDPGEARSNLKSVLVALTEPVLEIIEGEPQTAANMSEIAASPPDVTMVMVNGKSEQSLNFLQTESARNPRPVLLAVLSLRSTEAMKQALRAGADEILFEPLDAGEATRALIEISESRWRHERREGGVICSVMSMVGGVGVTSIAGNLALALNAMHQRVALVDLDFQTGSLAVFLNLEPEMTVMPLIRLDRKLDSLQLEAALTKHPSGIYLLAAPKRIEEAELVSDITVGTVLDLMRQLFSYVIVDCGDHVDENVVAAWERSDHLFYVLDQSIGAARCAWRFIDLFDRLGLPTLQPRFVLNRFSPSHPLTVKAIESTLARTISSQIPRDDRTFEQMEMKAQDLLQVAPNSALTRAVTELASQMIPHVEGPAATDSGIMSRIKSAFGGH